MPWKFVVRDFLVNCILDWMCWSLNYDYTWQLLYLWEIDKIEILLQDNYSGIQEIFLSSQFYLKWFLWVFSAFILTQFCPWKLKYIPKKTHEIKNWCVHSFQTCWTYSEVYSELCKSLTREYFKKHLTHDLTDLHSWKGSIFDAWLDSEYPSDIVKKLCKQCVLEHISWYSKLSIEILSGKTNTTRFDIIIFITSGWSSFANTAYKTVEYYHCKCFPGFSYLWMCSSCF